MLYKKSDIPLMDELIANLPDFLANGYDEEVRAFTRSIQAKPQQVFLFERHFDALVFDNLIHWNGTPSQDATLAKVAASEEQMRQFLEGIGRPYESYLIVTNHGTEITFEVGWRDQMAGNVVWDRWIEAVDDPVMAFANAGFLFDLLDYQCATRPTEKPEPPLYRYHPERFKAYRDYAEIVGKFYRQKVEPQSGMLTVPQLNEVMRVVFTELNRRSMDYPRRLKESHPAPSLVIEAEETLATAYGRFVQAGRQIMDFPPALTEMLAKTDIDDIPLNSIKLPYASQYLYFGPQVALELEPGWFVDGAYVEQRGLSGDVRFTITAAPDDRSLTRQWYLFPEAEYTQDFVESFRSMDLATAIDTVLSDRLAALKAHQDRNGGDITVAVQAEFVKNGVAMPDAVRVVDVGPQMAVTRDEIARRRHPIYKAALQLAVNALCYVSAYPDDIETVWPEGTPVSLKEKVLSGKGKEQMRAKSKLAALGYVPVHICGKRIAEQRTLHGIHPQEHAHVSTHWRRGHWRNQVHGPAWSLRKLIWVMPVIVGAKDHDDPEAGHLYLVS